MSQVVTYPIDVIAKVLDLTPRRVRQLVDEGVIPREERGRYALIACVRGTLSSSVKRLKLGSGTSAEPDRSEERRESDVVRLLGAPLMAAALIYVPLLHEDDVWSGNTPYPKSGRILPGPGGSSTSTVLARDRVLRAATAACDLSVQRELCHARDLIALDLSGTDLAKLG